ncbi:hypothetical protein [Anaerobacillus sp. CMMVII]|uniref:hypothetical protein n=1 Tax=Anaerobacillus sp. CMMVII TaxID=2755588 RepID=UPI0028E0A32B|nr:hypothetical protein [Anaerobacillus sp. CMMVII]
MNHTLIDLYQPESGKLNVPYQPVETTEIIENPPRFTWMPAKLDGEVYVLEVSSSQVFELEFTRVYQPINLNFLLLITHILLERIIGDTHF